MSTAPFCKCLPTSKLLFDITIPTNTKYLREYKGIINPNKTITKYVLKFTLSDKSNKNINYPNVIFKTKIYPYLEKQHMLKEPFIKTNIITEINSEFCEYGIFINDIICNDDEKSGYFNSLLERRYLKKVDMEE